MTGKGVGARLPRKEDRRFLLGQGEYVGNIRLPGMLEVAFVRSPVAHAKILQVSKPSASVFTAEDLIGVKAIRAVSALKGFKPSEQPVLARDKVRQVGELVAMCVAPTRAEAEDLADQVEISFEELPAVVDMLDARLKPPGKFKLSSVVSSLTKATIGPPVPEAIDTNITMTNLETAFISPPSCNLICGNRPAELNWLRPRFKHTGTIPNLSLSRLG